MDHHGIGGSLALAAFALAVALLFAPVVRSATGDLNQSLGRVGPFASVRCHAPTSPGCGPADLHLAGTSRGLIR